MRGLRLAPRPARRALRRPARARGRGAREPQAPAAVVLDRARGAPPRRRGRRAPSTCRGCPPAPSGWSRGRRRLPARPPAALPGVRVDHALSVRRLPEGGPRRSCTRTCSCSPPSARRPRRCCARSAAAGRPRPGGAAAARSPQPARVPGRRRPAADPLASSAKSGALTVRELEAETSARHADRARGHGRARPGAARGGAAREAASLAVHLLALGAQVELSGPGIAVPLGRGRAHQVRLLTELALYAPAASRSAAAPPRPPACARCGSGSGR